MKITVKNGDSQLSVEFDSIPRDFQRVIGSLDRLLRMSFPDQMHRKCLNLSRDTSRRVEAEEIAPVPSVYGYTNQTIPASQGWNITDNSMLVQSSARSPGQYIPTSDEAMSASQSSEVQQRGSYGRT